MKMILSGIRGAALGFVLSAGVMSTNWLFFGPIAFASDTNVYASPGETSPGSLVFGRAQSNRGSNGTLSNARGGSKWVGGPINDHG